METPHFNKLSPAELELLAILSEECGEVVQVIGKILRHGLDFKNPLTHECNRALLTDEMGDVRAAMIRLTDAGIVTKEFVHQRADQKLRYTPYLRHQHQPKMDADVCQCGRYAMSVASYQDECGRWHYLQAMCEQK